MLASMWRCLTRAQLDGGLGLVVLCVSCAVACAVRARRHFGAGRNWLGTAMIGGVVASGASAVLWAVVTASGIPPFFIGVMHFPPCDEGARVIVDPSAGQHENPIPRAP